MNDFLGEVDVLQGKPERLPLPEPKTGTDHKEEAGVGLLLFADPGVEYFEPVHDAATGPHAEARRPLPPVAPDVEGVGREAEVLGGVLHGQERRACGDPGNSIRGCGKQRLRGHRRFL